ncbi:MAG: molybdenum cofactor biosynthesis protein MoaE [Deltaproteobacteria bacterium]|nr:molybdenum cofactor biosynthesis protein MoaE [Deltaproteobacteria bacterium]
MKTIATLYFAHVREKVGVASETFEVADDATVGAVVLAIVERHPALGVLMPSVRVALDGEFVALDAAVGEGRELVLIPPVAGGSGDEHGAGVAKVALGPEVLDDARAAALAGLVGGPGHGAVLTFSGVVRDHARGRAVTELEYEAYPSMAQTKLAEIVAACEAQWPGTRLAIHHRVGRLVVGDVAVIAAAGSAHRAAAFEALRELLELLKREVPIWKREVGPDGASWVSDRP